MARGETGGGLLDGPRAADPTQQRISPDGQAIPKNSGPTEAEMFLQMWRNAEKMTGKTRPIPEHLRKRFNLPDDMPRN